MRYWAMRTTVWSAVLVGLAGGVPVLHGEPWPDGVYRLTVENAVPFTLRRDRSGADGRGREHWDLELRLVRRGGQFEEAGHGWVALMPALEHRAVVVQQRAGGEGGDSVVLEVEVLFGHQWPRLTGGSGRYELVLRWVDGEVVGAFSGAVRGLDEAERTALLRSMGVRGALPAMQGVRGGEVRSVTNIARELIRYNAKGMRAIVARGSVEPLSPTVVAGVPAVLLTGEIRDRLRAHGSGPRGAAVLEAVRGQLGSGLTGGFGGGDEPRRSVGMAALGHALLYVVTGEAGCAAHSGAEAQRWVDAAWADFTAAREVVAVALAYEACGAAWSEELRGRVRARLAEFAGLVSGRLGAERLEASVFGAGGLVGEVEGPWCCRLAMFRSAGGVAALAILSDAGAAALHGAAQEDLGVCRSSVERFLRTGIGDRGAGTGAHGLAECVETLFVMLRALREGRGEDLAAGTGVGWVATWGAAGGGQCFGRADFADGPWLAMGVGLAEAPLRGALHAYGSERPLRVANPLHGLFVLLDLSEVVRADAGSAGLPRTLVDRRMGAYLTRSGGGAGAVCTIMRMGRGPVPASVLRGQVWLEGLGQTWARPAVSSFGTFGWPAAEELNTLQIRDEGLARRGLARPVGPGRLERLHVERDGSMSVSMAAGGFVDQQNAVSGDPMPDGRSWRTLGVDHSGAGGCAAVWVLVEGATDTGDRQQVWSLDLGAMPAARVEVEGNTFVIDPDGVAGGANLRGVVVYPVTAEARVVGAEASGGQPRRLEVRRTAAGSGSLTGLLDEMDRRLDERLTRMLGEEETNLDVRSFDLRLEEQHLAARERALRESEAVFLKLLRETSSVQMGGGDRRPRARASWVMVLTLQEGPAPPVRVLDTQEAALLEVGGLRVGYVEGRIVFSAVKADGTGSGEPDGAGTAAGGARGGKGASE